MRGESVLYSQHFRKTDEGLFIETITQPDPKGYLPSSVVFAGLKMAARKQLLGFKSQLMKKAQ